jgi:hypothetical protein
MLKTLIFKDIRPPSEVDFKNFHTTIPLDWHGRPIDSPPSFLFWLDHHSLHFLARHEGGPGTPHPDGSPGKFRPELWKYDVAEFFLGSRNDSHYLEFNLSPSGAWWSCLFEERLVPAPGQPIAIPQVHAEGKRTASFWEARASLPRLWLEERFPIEGQITLNATFILGTPKQIFASAADLGDGDPDFHRPARFPGVKLIAPA